MWYLKGAPDRREMVEELSSPSLLTEFLKVPALVTGWFPDHRHRHRHPHQEHHHHHHHHHHLDLPNQVGGGLQDCGEVAVRRLCCQRGDSQELSLGLMSVMWVMWVLWLAH